MPVENRKSTQITNADATPPVLNNSAVARGVPFVACATIEVAAADDDTSIYRLIRVPSNAVMQSLVLFNDAITAGTSYDFGLLQTAANGGGATGADIDVFATAVDLSSARTTGTEILFEALNIDQMGRRVWEILGLSSDPGREYDLVASANTVGTAAGTITIRAMWTA